MPRQHGERADFTSLVICCDMDDSYSLCRSTEPLAVVQCMMLRPRRHALARDRRLRCVLNGWRKKVSTLAIAWLSNAFVHILFSYPRTQSISPEQRIKDTDPATEFECEIDDLIAEHGSERDVIRALMHDLTVLMIDADRSVSRGYLRGLFSLSAVSALETV
ncbi:hypothetical protein [Bosea sp. 124]|uniref:hypothetical protein n=1 Tax=Bosea sp. 124 TaxID=2135642 RepID=UPI000D39D1B6|nr:hypothetical protein [Bosea sp. 124]